MDKISSSQPNFAPVSRFSILQYTDISPKQVRKDTLKSEFESESMPWQGIMIGHYTTWAQEISDCGHENDPDSRIRTGDIAVAAQYARRHESYYSRALYHLS